MATAQTSRWSKYTPFLVWLPFIAVFAAIQLSTNRFAGNDGYYHIKYAWLLWHEGAVWDFPWLRGTFFHESWVDTEFLYHVFLIPFTLTGDLYLAGKIAPVFWGSVGLFSVYWVIREQGEPGSDWRKYAWWSALVIAAASYVGLYRLSMPRVPAVSLTFMMLGILLLKQGHWKRVAWLGFFYAWMYPVSVVLIPLALFQAIAKWYDDDEWDFRLVGAAAAGVFAGFIINPYFPRTLPILFNHVVEIGIGTSDLPKGAEWSPYDSWFMFHNCLVAWIALFLGGLSMIGTPTRGRHIFYLASTAMMMLAYFKSRRFVEYWPYFSVLFSAAAFHDALKAPESFVNRVRRLMGPRVVSMLVMVVSVALVSTTVRNIRRAGRDVSVNAEPTRLAGAARWLAEHTPAGTQVYNAQWDIFPELIFYNHRNHWTLGLDPNFTYEVDPKLYYGSAVMNDGALSEPGRFIQNHFGARYALSLNRAGFTRKARLSTSGLKRVYHDDTGSVFEVVPVDGLYTVEAELEPFQADLDPEVGHCRHRREKLSDRGRLYGFLQCRLKRPVPFKVKYELDILRSASYEVRARIMTGASGGEAVVRLDGRAVSEPFPLAGDKRRFESWKRLGRSQIDEGERILTIDVTPEVPPPPPQDDGESPEWRKQKWRQKYPIEVSIDALRLSLIK